ncbi:MAG: hypothetical protein M3H12_02345 [Chromatiales bacterium]|uniref:hypothetical protein n=1 Tax=endosymbiont of Lamellibrachia barhami TaxID=205975 RepID=UPI0015ADE580|nr:hypothetical protein [endosymbiont of Lamellibrachia barhami]MBA1444587.1 hypothetical protein [Gammaproteobacteria bacterium]
MQLQHPHRKPDFFFVLVMLVLLGVTLSVSLQMRSADTTEIMAAPVASGFYLNQG